MKKFFPPIFILILFSQIIYGQVTVTIGTGTLITSGGESSITPYKTFWYDGQDQILFTSAELLSAGLGAGNITQLGFDVGGTPDTITLHSFTISAQQVSETALTVFLTSGWTTCYTADITASSGWNMYTFTTPFNWDGTSSLVFKICYDNDSYTDNTHVYYTSLPSTGVHLYYLDDLTISSGCDVLDADGETNRPNVRITGQQSTSPYLQVNPVTLSFGTVLSDSTSDEMTYQVSGNNLTPASGNITITPPANFEVSQTAGSGFSATPINIPYSGGLLPGTTVYVVFKPTVPDTNYLGDITNSGGGAASQFVTVDGYCACVPDTLPMCESFPNNTWPACWTIQLVGSIISNHWSLVNTSNAGGTQFEAEANYYPDEGALESDQNRMVSPPLNINGVDAVNVTFKQMFDDFDQGNSDVWIKVQYSFNGRNFTDAWSHLGGSGNSIPAETKSIIIPTGGQENTIWIAWTLAGYTFDINFWYVDDICIDAAPSHEVEAVSINNIPGIVVPTTQINPVATVRNNGFSAETFDVNLEITDGYSSTKSVTNLAIGDTQNVVFDTWTATEGIWNAQVCTNLASDADTSNDCKAMPVKVHDPVMIYAYISYDPTSTFPEGPAHFMNTSPGSITSLDTTTSTNFIAAGTWANGTWYGSEYYDSQLTTGGGWYTIDTATGAMTLLASLNRSFNGITYDLTNGIMYGLDWNNITNDLFTIVPATGAATYLGSVGTNELLINLATDGTGFLYALGISTNHLFKIDPSGTPSITDVGPTGLSLNYAQDMEYDHFTNTMYSAAYTTSGGSLYVVDLATGACTLVDEFENSCEISGMAIPYCVDNNQWTGNVSMDWSDPQNWTCGTVPGSGDRVYLSSAPSGGLFPVISNGVAAECFDITVAPGSNLIIQPGGSLNVINP